MISFTIDSPYLYKGSSNTTVTLLKDEDGYIHCINNYGERMVTVWTLGQLGHFLAGLDEGGWA